ncbi:hypothetical protein TNCV_3953131 [Trichonephila clavipes]|nr:hypothetical protein TNCV_3953131 [Trichonephila clavipes]
MVKVSDHGRYAMSSSPVPIKNCREGVANPAYRSAPAYHRVARPSRKSGTRRLIEKLKYCLLEEARKGFLMCNIFVLGCWIYVGNDFLKWDGCV